MPKQDPGIKAMHDFVVAMEKLPRGEVEAALGWVNARLRAFLDASECVAQDAGPEPNYRPRSY